MIELRMTLDGAAVTLYRPQDAQPAGCAYPYLSAIDDLRTAAHGQHIGLTGETPSLRITLDVAGASLIGYPLGAAASVWIDGEQVLDGVVAEVAYGDALTITLEA